MVKFKPGEEIRKVGYLAGVSRGWDRHPVFVTAAQPLDLLVTQGSTDTLITCLLCRRHTWLQIIID